MYRFGNYLPNFPIQPIITSSGKLDTLWLGGDVGFTCYLSPTKSVSVFGDTYYGQQRHPTVIVGNTIAINEHRNGSFTTNYYGSPFFDFPKTNTRISCLKPFTYNNILYVFLYRKNSATGAPIETVLANISNPLDNPLSWNINYTTIPGWFGNECIINPPDLIIYGNINNRVVAGTIPLSNLNQDNQIKIINNDCKIPTTAGFSSRYNSYLQKWQITLTDTTINGGFPDYLSVMLGPGPFGPWSPQRIAGYFPEMTNSDPDNIVYAVFEATDYEADPGKDLTIIYTVGSRKGILNKDTSRQIINTEIYRVRSTRFRNPWLS